MIILEQGAQKMIKRDMEQRKVLKIIKRSMEQGKKPGARGKIKLKRSREHKKMKRSKEESEKGVKGKKLKGAGSKGEIGKGARSKDPQRLNNSPKLTLFA